MARQVGLGRALEIILSARDFDADEAEAYGTINKALDPDEIGVYVDKLARRIAKFPAESINACKQAVYESIDKPIDEALRAEAYWLYQATSKTPAIKRFTIADEQGMEHARLFGRAVEQLQLAFGEVLSSPYCRARRTLELATGSGTYVTEPMLRSSCFAAASAIRERRAWLAARLGTTPAPGTNTLLMTHFCNISTFARQTLDWCGIRIKPGTSVVYRPHEGGYEALGCIAAETWREWGR